MMGLTPVCQVPMNVFKWDLEYIYFTENMRLIVYHHLFLRVGNGRSHSLNIILLQPMSGVV
jgi:hypothetical protein